MTPGSDAHACHGAVRAGGPGAVAPRTGGSGWGALQDRFGSFSSGGVAPDWRSGGRANAIGWVIRRSSHRGGAAGISTIWMQPCGGLRSSPPGCAGWLIAPLASRRHPEVLEQGRFGDGSPASLAVRLLAAFTQCSSAAAGPPAAPRAQRLCGRRCDARSPPGAQRSTMASAARRSFELPRAGARRADRGRTSNAQRAVRASSSEVLP